MASTDANEKEDEHTSRGGDDDKKKQNRKKRGEDGDNIEDGVEVDVADDDKKGSSRKRSRRHRRHEDEDSKDSEEEDAEEDRRRRHKKRKRKKESSSSGRKRSDKKKSSSRTKRGRSSSKQKKKKRCSSSSSSDESSSSASSDDSSSSDGGGRKSSKNKKTVMNDKLLAKLSARGETLEERKERRAQKRAAKIQARFGYTAEENPFNDPNLHETFNWTKKKDKATAEAERAGTVNDTKQNRDTIEEIETIRRRRKERELEREEMDRLRAEESRMKELENYDEWAKKEEEFHLEQQRKRSAIRLVEGREKPIDILAKNLLLFGLSDEEKQKRAAVKYQERYNALDEVQKLDAELEEPQKIVSYLKLVELQELLIDIDAFRLLEKEAMGESGNPTIITYWEALSVVVRDEIKFLQNGGEGSANAKKMDGIRGIFEGQSRPDLSKMREEIEMKLRKAANPSSGADADLDRSYWISVLEQLAVHLAKMDLSELHSKMLVRQLEKLEQRKEELAEQQKTRSIKAASSQEDAQGQEVSQSMVPQNVDLNFGNLEEELGLTDEVALAASGKQSYSWQDRYAPRKPRYFNRVRTGFDWNKYNQTHYDSENPPPKIVQGYKFNIFYPDLVDPTKTPQYFLERADSDEFCILRFHAGPPYEDIAFKIINREWNKSRKRGFRSTFERGVLSLYFNFTTHWYRR